jgi:hypothetical protein
MQSQAWLLTCVMAITFFKCSMYIMFMGIVSIHWLDFVIKYILLAYNSSTGGDSLWHLHMCLQHIIPRFTPLCNSPSFFFPYFLEQFQQGSLSYFHKWLQTLYIMFTIFHPFLCPHPPTGTHPKEPLLHSCLSFYKCVLVIQRGFTLVFQICIYGALMKFTPLLFTLF